MPILPSRTILEIVTYFLRLGAIGMGGPVALCDTMERDLVERRGWLSKEEMREAIALSQTLPGSFALQTGIFVGFARGGFPGAWASGWAFILPNFVIVTILAALYVRFRDLSWLGAVLYGIGPASIALILHACWRLSRLGMDDWFRWAIAAAAFAVTVAAAAEIELVFIAAGFAGVLYYGSMLRGPIPPAALATVAAPVKVVGTAVPVVAVGTFGKLLAFFLKAGSLIFGSGLLLTPVLQPELVQDSHWLSSTEFLLAITVGMATTGPMVIAATFVGYLVAGFWGAVVSTVGMLLPSFLMVMTVAPILRRHRANENVQGFIRGTYAAAIGTILGACVLLGRGAIDDWLTALIALGSLAALCRFRVSSLAVIGIAGAIGFFALPILHPGWTL
jgi:chromate transporter